MFVLIPAAQQVDDNLLRHHVRSFGIDFESLEPRQADRLVLDAAADRGLAVVSATDRLRSALGFGAEPYGRIDSQLSPAGHRVV